MSFCTHCGAKVKETARFCGNCGCLLSEQEPAPKPAQPQTSERPEPQTGPQTQTQTVTQGVRPNRSPEQRKKNILPFLLLGLLGVGLLMAGIIFLPSLLQNGQKEPVITTALPEETTTEVPETASPASTEPAEPSTPAPTAPSEPSTTADPEPVGPVGPMENRTYLRKYEFFLYPYEAYQPEDYIVIQGSAFTIVTPQGLMEYQWGQDAVKISRARYYDSADGRAGIIRIQGQDEDEHFLYYDGESIFSLPEHAEPKAISWDGSSLFYGASGWRCRGQFREVAHVSDPLFSPDGHTLAWAEQFADSGAGQVVVQLLDWQQNEPRMVPLAAYPAALSNGGEILFYYDNSRNLYAFEQESGSTRLLIAQLASLAANADFNENRAYFTQEMDAGLFIDAATGMSFIWEKGAERRNIYPRPLYPLAPEKMAYAQYGSDTEAAFAVSGFESFKNRLYFTAPVTEGDKSLVDIVYLDENYSPILVQEQVEAGLILSSDGKDCWYEKEGQIYLLKTDELWKGTVEILHRSEAWDGWRKCVRKDGKSLIRIVSENAHSFEILSREEAFFGDLEGSYESLRFIPGGTDGVFIIAQREEIIDLYTVTAEGPVKSLCFDAGGSRRHIINERYVGELAMNKENGETRIVYRFYEVDEAAQAELVREQEILLQPILTKEEEVQLALDQAQAMGFSQNAMDVLEAAYAKHGDEKLKEAMDELRASQVKLSREVEIDSSERGHEKTVEYSYNAKGLLTLISERSSGYYERDNYSTQKEYDDNGRLIKLTNYIEESRWYDAELTKTLFYYFEDGKLEKEVVEKNGEITEKVYHYNEQGDVAKITVSVNGVADALTYDEWTYDEQGRVISKLEQSRVSQQTLDTILEFIESGYIKVEDSTTEFYDGKLTEYFYEDTGVCRVIHHRTSNYPTLGDGGYSVYEEQYNKEGQLFILIDSLGKVISEYDEQGRIANYYFQGLVTEYEYHVDDRGQLISKDIREYYGGASHDNDIVSFVKADLKSSKSIQYENQYDEAGRLLSVISGDTTLRYEYIEIPLPVLP